MSNIWAALFSIIVIQPWPGVQQDGGMPQPIAEYRCEENAANTTVADSQGTWAGTAGINTNFMDFATGKISACFDLPSAVQYNFYSSNATMWDTMPDSYSIGVWVDWDGVGVADAMWNKTTNYKSDNSATYDLVYLATTTGNKVELAMKINNSYNNLVGTTNLGSDWRRVVAVVTPTNRYIYFDGVEEASDSVADRPRDAGVADCSSRPMIWGGIWVHTGVGIAFDGRIDQCCVWDVALTPEQVAYDYNGGAGREY